MNRIILNKIIWTFFLYLKYIESIYVNIKKLSNDKNFFVYLLKCSVNNLNSYDI